jgi:hypothetical protein
MASSTVPRWDFARENIPVDRNLFEQILTCEEI